MSKKSFLQTAIGAIEPSKPRSVQKFQNYSPLLEGEQPPGNLPGGNEPGGQIPTGMEPMSSQPGGKEPAGNLYEGDLQSSSAPERVYGAKGKKKRERMVQAALDGNHSLSSAVQETLLKLHLADGWGKQAHGITRQLKSPGRHGLKLVDVALIMTVFDRTIALVNPVAFAPISAEDFRTDTGMDESNIRLALNALVNRGALLKIKTGLINFWALNPHYFSLKGRGEQPPGNLPGGNYPAGNAPGVKQGNLPGESGGQTTRGQSGQSAENPKGISAAKNLLQESKKESSLGSGSFPEDLVQRWVSFEKAGYGSKAKNEREIFEELFLFHGAEVFENCGGVVEFLEKHGSGKEGEEGKIHSPMVWIRNHWKLNITRYQNWKAKEIALNEAHAQKVEKEAKAKADQAQKEKARIQQEQEEAQWQNDMNADADRFLAFYTSEAEINAFVEEAVEVDGNDYVRGFWRKSGWNSPIVRSCVISHFRKVVSGERVSGVQRQVTEEIA